MSLNACSHSLLSPVLYKSHSKCDDKCSGVPVEVSYVTMNGNSYIRQMDPCCSHCGEITQIGE